MPADLTDTERKVLDIEGRFYRHQSMKEQAARDELDVSATRYAQLLNALLDRPEAEAYAPVTVHRLQRLRRSRTMTR